MRQQEPSEILSGLVGVIGTALLGGWMVWECLESIVRMLGRITG